MMSYELDDSRQTHLLSSIQNKVQTFITTTSLDGVQMELLNHPLIFYVDEGTIINKENEEEINS